MTALVSSGDDDDIEPKGITDARTLEDKEDMVQYVYVIEKNHQHCDMDGLLDIHSKVALGRVCVAPGRPFEGSYLFMVRVYPTECRINMRPHS